MPGLAAHTQKEAISFFVPLAKVGNDDERMCWGYASTEAVDSQGEIITLGALAGALPGYMKFANIREMHQLSAVGVAKDADLDDKGVYIGANVVDDNAWKKVKTGVYKGFSIGGRATKRDPLDAKKITGLELIEISLVDRPANPEALIEVWKSETLSSEGMMPAAVKKHDPVQLWNCGIPGHVHKLKPEAIKCMEGQEERFGGTSTTRAAVIASLANDIAALDDDLLAKATDVFSQLQRQELQKAAEDAEADEGKNEIEKLADKLENNPAPKGATVEIVAQMLECDVSKAEAAIALLIARQAPHMAKLMTGTDAKAAELPALRDDQRTGDPARDQALREAQAIIIRAAGADKAVDTRPKPADPPKPNTATKGDEEEKSDDPDEDAKQDAIAAELEKKDTSKPYGNVKYADPGYQSDGKKRYPIDTEEHIRAAWNYINKTKNAAKYSSSQVSSIKRRIVSAWKSKIDPEGPPSAAGKGKSKEKADMPQSGASEITKRFGKSDASVSVKKGIETVIAAMSLLKQINAIQNSLVLERDKEGDDSPMPQRWKTVMGAVAELVEDLAKEEIGEMLETGKDVDFRWGMPGYDIAWAAKAVRPARFAFSKSDFCEIFESLLGDDTGKPGYLMLSEFADAIANANGALSIEEWTQPGSGTGYGAHSADTNDSWGAHGATAQKIHDAAVEMGAKCNKADDKKDDKKKTHSDIPGAVGPGKPKDPPEDIREGADTGTNAKPPPKELAASAESAMQKMLANLIERSAEKEDRLLDIIERVTVGSQQAALDAQRDPPRPPKGKLFVVDKADDFQAPGSDGTGAATGTTKKGAEPSPDDVLKSVMGNPRFLSR